MFIEFLAEKAIARLEVVVGWLEYTLEFLSEVVLPVLAITFALVGPLLLIAYVSKWFWFLYLLELVVFAAWKMRKAYREWSREREG